MSTVCTEDIVTALAAFAARTQLSPSASRNQLRDATNQVHVPRTNVATFYNIKITHPPVDHYGDAPSTTEIVHVRPARRDSHGRSVEGRFDTVLVKTGPGICDTIAGMSFFIVACTSLLTMPNQSCGLLRFALCSRYPRCNGRPFSAIQERRFPRISHTSNGSRDSPPHRVHITACTRSSGPTKIIQPSD